MKKISSISGICAILVLFCLLFTSCTSADKITATQLAAAETGNDELRTPSQQRETVAENEFIKLSFDNKTFTVNVTDKSAERTWSTLAAKNTDLSYAFGLTLFTEDTIYQLNTQNHSVAHGTATYEIKDNILKVNYVLSDKAETAKKSYEEITESEVYISFSVTYTLAYQTMNVTIGDDIKCTPGAFIENITFMPCFGSSFNDGAEDYFLIPDGPGALMNLGTADANTDSISVKVYGADPFTQNSTTSASSTVPVFGVKRNSAAFAAVISEGDALAEIKAHRNNRSTRPSAVYSVFSITAVSRDEAGNPIRKGSTYTGPVSISYKFLSGNNADYTAMAAAAREEFIAASVMSSAKNDNGTVVPFHLNVAGYADSETLTTTKQTLDILGILRGKGINNIILSYKGLLSGGLEQKDLYHASVNRKLGGKEGLTELYEYTKKQGCELLIGTNIFSSSGRYIANGSKNTDGKNASFIMQNEMGYDANTSNALVTRIGTEAAAIGQQKTNPSIYSQKTFYTMNLRSIHTLQEKFPPFLESDILSNSDGISVVDAGRVLYSDAETDRETAKDIISSQTRAVSNFGNLTVEGGNIYTVYNAQLVSSMEFDTFYIESSNYEPVPFVQAILHGYINYTGTPIDAGDPLYRYEMLRFIEYGALPSYEWIYKNSNIYCYSGYLLAERVSEIVDFYNDACEILAPVAGETITSHRKILKDSEGNSVTGVYCTTYSDGTEIYVNYTGNIVTTSENIAIGPYDYVAVNR